MLFIIWINRRCYFWWFATLYAESFLEAAKGFWGKSSSDNVARYFYCFQSGA